MEEDRRLQEKEVVLEKVLMMVEAFHRMVQYSEAAFLALVVAYQASCVVGTHMADNRRIL